MINRYDLWHYRSYLGSCSCVIIQSKQQKQHTLAGCVCKYLPFSQKTCETSCARTVQTGGVFPLQQKLLSCYSYICHLKDWCNFSLLPLKYDDCISFIFTDSYSNAQPFNTNNFKSSKHNILTFMYWFIWITQTLLSNSATSRWRPWRIAHYKELQHNTRLLNKSCQQFSKFNLGPYK